MCFSRYENYSKNALNFLSDMLLKFVREIYKVEQVGLLLLVLRGVI